VSLVFKRMRPLLDVLRRLRKNGVERHIVLDPELRAVLFHKFINRLAALSREVSIEIE